LFKSILFTSFCVSLGVANEGDFISTVVLGQHFRESQNSVFVICSPWHLKGNFQALEDMLRLIDQSRYGLFQGGSSYGLIVGKMSYFFSV
jgi:hypothetical protein